LAQHTCFDCHSNEGRQHLNFSDWGHVREANEISRTIRSGWMPPAIYTSMHPEARLTQAETDALAAGIDATIKNK